MSDGGFLTTIHNMIVVAADKAYLQVGTSAMQIRGIKADPVLATISIPCEDVLRVVVSQIHLCRSTNWDPCSFSVIRL